MGMMSSASASIAVLLVLPVKEREKSWQLKKKWLLSGKLVCCIIIIVIWLNLGYELKNKHHHLFISLAYFIIINFNLWCPCGKHFILQVFMHYAENCRSKYYRWWTGELLTWVQDLWSLCESLKHCKYRTNNVICNHQLPTHTTTIADDHE